MAALHECRQRFGSLRLRVLAFLISSARIVGQAAELGVKITDAQVKKELARYNYNQIYGAPEAGEAELRKLLSGTGETRSDQLWLMKVHLLALKIEQKYILEAERMITPTQVARYYKHNRAQFVTPERRDVEAIVTFDEAAVKTAKREIASGKNFMSVADQRNEEPGVGGLKLGVRRGHIEHHFEKNFFAAPAHVLVGPLKGLLYYIFEVTRIVPAERQTLAQVEGTIRRRLIAGAQRRILTGVADVFEHRWTAKTSCSPGYIAQQCRQYVGM